jgi:DNA-directed RNA polymerase specialized sigma24 family protein
MNIARLLSYKRTFINYSYKDEMISDAIENCLAVVNNFDPAKSKNPFAYFTQITYFAFIRRIQREKKQLQTKYRYIDQLDISELITQEQDNGEFNNQFLDYLKTQLDGYDYEKVVSPATKAAMKKKENEESVLDSDPKL